MDEPGGPIAAHAAAADAGDPVTTDRILTIPNVITIVRLCCLPVFLWLLFARDNRAAAAVLLAVLGLTDFVDGYIARHFHQVSPVGKVIDPVADRVLFFVAAGGILIDGSVPAWFAWLVLIREILVSAAVLLLAALGAKRIDVTWWGKAGTFGLMFAFPMFLVSESTLRIAPLFEVLVWIAAIPGLILSWYAAFLYVPLARDALRAGRAGRRQPTGVPSAP
jgi:cardiolipin synthase